MRLNKLLQKDYTLSSLYYQIKLPLDVEILIPADDPVRLLSAFVEGMELSDLYQTYGRIKKNQATPRQLFKIMAVSYTHLDVYQRQVPAPVCAKLRQLPVGSIPVIQIAERQCALKMQSIPGPGPFRLLLQPLQYLQKFYRITVRI